MTGVLIERLVRRILQHQDYALECFATVGVSNALAVGDPATYDEKPGTINVIVAVDRSLSDAALVEAVAIVTEAKTRALFDARVKSTVSEVLATGTGTDCVALACPVGARVPPIAGSIPVWVRSLGRCMRQWRRAERAGIRAVD
jgi:iron complex transport system ATP-binding protein